MCRSKLVGGGIVEKREFELLRNEMRMMFKDIFDFEFLFRAMIE